MDRSTNAVDNIVRFSHEPARLLVSCSELVDTHVRQVLSRLDIPPNLQTLMLVVACVALVPLIIRLSTALASGIYRVPVMLMLLLIPASLVLPILH